MPEAIRRMEKNLQITESSIAVIGLGYVGLPLAVAFARLRKVIAYDINPDRVDSCIRGIDSIQAIPQSELLDLQKSGHLFFTANLDDAAQASIFIIAVPTLLTAENTPDLTALTQATSAIAGILKKGDLVIFESTVYPGATEEVCIPILESISGMKSGSDFFVGYSPERINPGDPVHRLENVKKIVSGQNAETLELVADLYETIIRVGVHRAPSIKVAEASKIVENCQRDFNIAYMNYLSRLLEEQGIESHAVLEAAKTKWNFLPFRPGLVGGHCVGLSSYYLTYRQKDKKDSPVLLARNINESVPQRVVDKLLELLRVNGTSVKGAKVGVLGLTFKENCTDVRNSGVIAIVNLLLQEKINCILTDPNLTKEDLANCCGLPLSDWADLNDLDALILATPHRQYDGLSSDILDSFFAKSTSRRRNIVLDITGKLAPDTASHYIYWRL